MQSGVPLGNNSVFGVWGYGKAPPICPTALSHAATRQMRRRSQKKTRGQDEPNVVRETRGPSPRETFGQANAGEI